MNAMFRRRRFWILLLLAIVLAWGGYATWSYYANQSLLKQAIAETDALDPRWRLADMLADRAGVPDDENSALVILRAFALEDRSDSKKLAEADVVGLDGVWENDQHRLNDVQKEALDVLLKAHEKSLPEYRKIANMSKGRYPDPRPGANLATELPPSTRSRGAVMALRYDFLDRLEREDMFGEIQDLHGMMSVAESLANEATSLSISLRLAIRRYAPYSICRWLAQERPSNENLKSLQERLESELRLNLLKCYLRSERAECFEYFELAMANFNLPSGKFAVAKRFLWDHVWDPGRVVRTKAEYLNLMNQLIQASSMPLLEQEKALAKMESTILANPEMRPFVANVFKRIHNSFRHSEAVMSCAVAALGAERFRTNNHRWPNSLNELFAVGLLKSVPVDPYDGKPLRWITTNNGRLLYSIGQDRTDNGGAYDPKTSSTDPGNDIIFRLYDPKQRRLPPVPVKPKDNP